MPRSSSSRSRRRGPRGPERELLHGITPVLAALRAGRREMHRLWVREGARSDRLREVVESAQRASVPISAVEDEELDRRTGGGTAASSPLLHQGVVLGCGPLPLLSLKDYLASAGADPLLLALDRIEDPQNLGGLVRTAAFLGADAVLVHRSHRAPFNAVVSKASAGTLEHFPVVEVGNLADALQRLARDGWRVLGSALDDGAVAHHRLQPRDHTVLVMGNEGEGLRPLTARRCEQLVMIPRRGPAESLNVTVAAGVLLSQLASAQT